MEIPKENEGTMKTEFGRWGAKVDAVTAAARDKWQTIKTGVASAWNELEVTFKKLTHRET